jgi:glutamate/tyrosine decarboxylase-like PLP-dependent enzyme
MIHHKKSTLLINADLPVLDQLPPNCNTIHLIPDSRNTPLTAMFIGPKAENGDMLVASINSVMDDYIYWRKNYFPADSSSIDTEIKESSYLFFDEFNSSLQSMLNELKEGFPFHSPRYMGHMLSGQTLPSIVGYFAGMLYNPNNVTDEAAPITVAKEIEYGKTICQMIGYTSNSWAHICSGGTLANLEALWIARLVQFLPLCIQEVCEKYSWDFKIKTPDFSNTKDKKNILSLDVKALLSLQPNEALYMTSNLLKYLTKDGPKLYSFDNAIQLINEGVKNSKFNIRNKGLITVMENIKAKFKKTLRPVFFVPESAHYSFKKAIGLLGYGEDTIRNIPIGADFRINTEKLKEMLYEINDDEYIAAVVCVVGTTEEGAVDPVHRVKWLRDEFGRTRNQSFWLHVDSAWGGFVRTLFCDDYGHDRPEHLHNRAEAEDYSTAAFKDKVLKMMTRISAKEEIFDFEIGKKVTFTWNDIEVYSAYMAMSSADSVSVDPHKLGYVPYPAGVIAFKNKLVTTLVAQDAPYISTTKNDVAQIDIPEINAIGSYIIEGSKPGAAALSCWFSAKMIPLDLHHHGKIIKTSLLNAKRLAYCIETYHRHYFKKNDAQLVSAGYFKENTTRPFIFKLLYRNIDTNVVCFMVIPAYWDKNKPGKMEITQWSLKKINRLNEDIYSQFTINPTTRINDRKAMMAQRFFVSKTILKKESYNYDSIKTILATLGYNKSEYEENGLFVMRLTVMNPWYYLTKKNNGIDYFKEFLAELHYQSRKVIESYDATPDSIL